MDNTCVRPSPVSRTTKEVGKSLPLFRGANLTTGLEGAR